VNKDFDNVRRHSLSIKKARKHQLPTLPYDEEAQEGPVDPLDEKEIKDVVEKLINTYCKSEQGISKAKSVDKQTALVTNSLVVIFAF
jgi:hypothetical protein